MPISRTIKTNLYKDSVALMRIAQTILTRDGVRQATLVMGTPANKDILAQAGLLDPALEKARPSDIMIVVDAETGDVLDAAAAEVARLLEGERPSASSGHAAELPLRSISMARSRDGAEAALAQISVPGPYAAAEAMKALRQGLHVFLFSDNVPLEQERAIKVVARGKGLLVMGPDCGTAIVGGTPLGFANVVRRGTISLVGASGTGLQEVTCQIHALGQGVRHAIGTGGHDVSAEIGGITMQQALDLLAADPGTRVIAIVSKPPAPEVARQVLERAAKIDKPVVALFLGDDLPAARLPQNVTAVPTLYAAAVAAVGRVGGKDAAAKEDAGAWLCPVHDEAARLAAGQRLVRGLYSGGTFCAEAQLIWRDLGLRVHSNAPLDKRAADVAPEGAHAAIDLGADEFTVGRPHPMIDPSTRIDRIAATARDSSTAAIVLDVVLGYGSHPDPAGALAPAIAAARAACAKEGRHLPVVSFVCGTEEDPQRLSAQQAQLREAGALVLPSSTAAARAAGEIALRA
ncbi:MAG TPA: acyl-CoA synthetase FdrA [Casimicrobiaceae bacterium]|nr:acyl-CoA synthetase FdrA [Casimicrobiaceae bacterium]